MKKIAVCLSMFCFLWCVACFEDDKVGEVVPLTMTYELPQGKSTADDRIVELYNQYGMYILYEYKDRDFYYDNYFSSTIYELSEPDYVQDMMNLLDDIWFDLYPEEFHQRTLPYQVFLASKLGNVMNGDTTKLFVQSGAFSLAIGNCSDSICNISSEKKLELKNELQIYLWMNRWIDQDYINVPEEFEEVSTYESAVVADDETSPDYFRARGFVSDFTNPTWLGGWPDVNTDLQFYIEGLLTWSSERWKEELEWPLVKKKYDMLRSHFLENYGFDIQKIGDMEYK